MKYWCAKKKQFIAPPKVFHYCQKSNCPHLTKKRPTDVIYRFYRHHVNGNLEPVTPCIGQTYAGPLKRR